jgi:hypothetical protein
VVEPGTGPLSELHHESDGDSTYAAFLSENIDEDFQARARIFGHYGH